MHLGLEIRKRLKAMLWPFAFACIAAYFGVHLVRNDHGLLALQAYDAKLLRAERELSRLTRDRVALERETRWLRPELTHPDSLGEQARRRVGMIASDEYVLLGR